MSVFHRAAMPTVAVASVLLLTSCATSSPGGGAVAFGEMYPAPPDGEVVVQGTVIDTGDGAELCLGAVTASLPPQCSGIPLEGWTWDGLPGSETAADTTWGAYAVPGTYDGEVFTVTGDPIVLALYDPMPFPDPTEGRPGKGTDAELRTLQEELPKRLGDSFLTSSVSDGYLWIDVVWDDGTLQNAADAEFGEDVVVVRSAMREVG